jgi:hypothetical protein
MGGNGGFTISCAFVNNFTLYMVVFRFTQTGQFGLL